jgi:hypothetical protein
MDVKKVFTFSGFPSHLASDEDKKEDKFGLQMAKAIEKEWFYRPENGTCSYYDKRDKYHNLRLYARGEQNTKIYKDLIAGGDDSSYTNYDWRPIQVVPKFMNLIVNQMSERLFNIKAEAIDKYSTDLKDKHKEMLQRFLVAKPAMEEAKNTLGVDLLPDNVDEFPDSQEEIDLHMKLKYKPAIEIACEEAIKYTLELNDYDEVQSKVIEDIASIGLGAIKHGTDINKGIMVEYVDPANLVYSYPTHRNFKDVYYYGEVKRMTISELKRISNGKFNDEQLQNIANATSEWTRYHGFNSNEQQYREDDMQGAMVDVLFFNFKSLNTISYKKKYNKKSGGYKMLKKKSDFTKPDPKYDGYSVSKKMIDVWYEGALILGTDHLFNYRLCENMIRPKGNLNRTLPNYVLYAPEIYQNRTRSLVERIVPYVDEMQQIHIKLQQLIAKARPNGIFIDVDGLNEIDMGDGNFLTPLEAIRIYDQTGNVIGTSTTAEGEYNHGKMPVTELNNGIISGLDRLIAAYNHYQGLVGDAIGIPRGVDASTPHPDTLVGVQQQVALNSNTATRHILNSALNISERLGKGITLRLADIFEYSDLKAVYINAIGKINVEVLKALKKYHLHDLGLNIELKPDSQEKTFLENNIQKALDRDAITIDDTFDIRSIDNIKLAKELLKVRRMKREKAKKEHEKEMITSQGEANANVARANSEAKQKEIQMKSDADQALVKTKSDAKVNELNVEGGIKSGLMKEEFEYNMMLKGIERDVLQGDVKYKEDRKDQRQKDNNEHSIKMLDKKNKKDLGTFESSLDNVSGSMELAEQAPS